MLALDSANKVANTPDSANSHDAKSTMLALTETLLAVPSANKLIWGKQGSVSSVSVCVGVVCVWSEERGVSALSHGSLLTALTTPMMTREWGRSGPMNSPSGQAHGCGPVFAGPSDSPSLCPGLLYGENRLAGAILSRICHTLLGPRGPQDEAICLCFQQLSTRTD